MHVSVLLCRVVKGKKSHQNTVYNSVHWLSNFHRGECTAMFRYFINFCLFISAKCGISVVQCSHDGVRTLWRTCD